VLEMLFTLFTFSLPQINVNKNSLPMHREPFTQVALSRPQSHADLSGQYPAQLGANMPPNLHALALA
jgi:hypothetical protein